MSKVETIVELGALERIAPAWDALALATAAPMNAPSWMLAWWRHLAPEHSELRALVVYDGEESIGIAPFYFNRPRRGEPLTYRLLAADISTSVSPLAKPGREWEVAEAIAGALGTAEHRPDLLALAPMALASPWPAALRERWPGRTKPRAFTYELQEAPIVSLHEESFAAWLSTRSAKFRTKMRRLQRLFASEGGATRLSDTGTLGEDVASFARLHSSRWEGKGGHSRLVALCPPILPWFELEIVEGAEEHTDDQPALLFDQANLPLGDAGVDGGLGHPDEVVRSCWYSWTNAVEVTPESWRQLVRPRRPARNVAGGAVHLLQQSESGVDVDGLTEGAGLRQTRSRTAATE